MTAPSRFRTVILMFPPFAFARVVTEYEKMPHRTVTGSVQGQPRFSHSAIAICRTVSLSIAVSVA